ncbi:MAG: recombinase family protein [Bacilli bacterium]|nr:recombinase family protein [Bacilli bacterium]
MEEKIVTGIYIRVSTEDQAKDGFSIHAQREKLTKYAEANDWHIYDYYVDDGISGKNLDGRPEVTRLLNDVKEGKVNNVLIYKLDRLTRSVRDLIYLIELFEKHSCTFNSQTEKIDTSNAVGRMFVKIIGIFAEFERENLAERVSFGYEQKTREGNYTNTNGVYGYDYIIGENRIEVNEFERELVNKIFDLYIDGESYFKIARAFNAENVPTKRGGHWSATTIKSIINNPLYIGKVRYGLQEKNKDKAFTVDGKNIEPIVDEDKWNLANNIVDTRKHYCSRRYPSENSYYFHIIKCDKCDGHISARQQTHKGKLYISYRCNNSARGFCDAKCFSHNLMENAFLEYLDTLETLKPDKSILENKKIVNSYEKEKEEIEKKITKLEEKKKSVRSQFINDLISIDEYKSIIDEIEKQENMWKNKVATLIEDTTNIVESYTYEDVKEIVTNIKLNWKHLTNKERQQFLERFVDNIKVYKVKNKVKIKCIDFKKL